MKISFNRMEWAGSVGDLGTLLPLAFGMLPFVLALAAFHLWLQMSPFSGMHASLGMFAGGIIGVYLGHRGQGGLRSTFKRITVFGIGILGGRTVAKIDPAVACSQLS